MDQGRFETISKLFAQRRLSRRQAMQRGAAGLAAAGLATVGLRAVRAQDGTPAAEASPTAGGEVAKTEFLFVQSFESGTVAPKDGTDGTFTLTLQHGLGQTLYFSDRPERIVGAAPTAKFLDGLGFSPSNPPNAALVADDGNGGVTLAVVELTNPVYDEASKTATYDLTVLQDYEQAVDIAFQEAPADLAALGATLGASHLFIDDCDDQPVVCLDPNGNQVADLGRQGYCWSWDDWVCHWCTNYTDVCNQTYAHPNGTLTAMIDCDGNYFPADRQNC